jgi:hypothetical protein
VVFLDPKLTADFGVFNFLGRPGNFYFTQCSKDMFILVAIDGNELSQMLWC